MIVCIPFFSGDASQAAGLLKFIKDLGGCPEHNLLLVADAGIQWSIGFDMIALGNKAFKNAGFITTKDSVQGWPQGANALFRTAAQHCKDHHTSFLWLEPDAVPLRATWLKEIQEAYTSIQKTQRKPFMGRIYSGNNPSAPAKSMSGIAVYPENAIDIVGPFTNDSEAFDMAMSEAVVPQCENTNLIHHFWGPSRELPPTFASTRTPASPLNTFTLESVDPKAAIFHRCKDGTLINLLRRKLIPGSIQISVSSSRQFDVVFPFCATDAELALTNMQWMAELQDNYPYTIVLAVDDHSRKVHEIRSIAQEIFSQVIMFKYPVPPVLGHPQAANWAFRHTAMYMQERGNPWFWMEPDLIPLKPLWLDALQDEYERCGKDCMGSIIHEMSHCNGTAVYPANLAATCPNLMNMPDGQWAFDTVIKDEMIHRTHDAGHLMCHVWVMHGDLLLPYGSGVVPTFPNKSSMRNIPKGAYTLHRNKDATLIYRLREQRNTQ